MKLDEWPVYGEVGTSSLTMWAAIKRVVPEGSFMSGRFDLPYDTDDFARCYKLVKSCNVSPEDLQNIKKIFPWYAPLIDNWQMLCERFENGRRINTILEWILKAGRRINEEMDNWTKPQEENNVIC